MNFVWKILMKIYNYYYIIIKLLDWCKNEIIN